MADQRRSGWVRVLAVHMALFITQVGMSGYQIITRIALSGGMSHFTFLVYRGAISLCLLAPFAFFIERNKRPPLTLPLIGYFFLLGVTGVFLSQALYLEGLSYTSPAIAAAIQNSIPAITFVIAAAFGQERVHIKRLDGQAKLLGTALCIVGATIMTLYKGPAVIKVEQDSNASVKQTTGSMDRIRVSDQLSLAQGHWEPLYEWATQYLDVDTRHRSVSSFYPAYNAHRGTPEICFLHQLMGMESWQLGALYVIGMCIAFSFWLVIQSPVIKQYPARLSVTAYTTLFGTLQLLLLALWEVRDEPSKWVLRWGSELLSVLYAGVVVSGFVFSLQMWCVQHGGAFLTAVYQPVQTVIVSILTLLVLRENFYLGSLIGGLSIIGGLYLVVWGQGKDRDLGSSLARGSTPSEIRATKEKCNAGVDQPLGDEEGMLVRPLLLNEGLTKSEGESDRR